MTREDDEEVDGGDEGIVVGDEGFFFLGPAAAPRNAFQINSFSFFFEGDGTVEEDNDDEEEDADSK